MRCPTKQKTVHSQVNHDTPSVVRYILISEVLACKKGSLSISELWYCIFSSSSPSVPSSWSSSVNVMALVACIVPVYSRVKVALNTEPWSVVGQKSVTPAPIWTDFSQGLVHSWHPGAPWPLVWGVPASSTVLYLLRILCLDLHLCYDGAQLIWGEVNFLRFYISKNVFILLFPLIIWPSVEFSVGNHFSLRFRRICFIVPSVQCCFWEL